jgi:hypothetical protein
MHVLTQRPMSATTKNMLWCAALNKQSMLDYIESNPLIPQDGLLARFQPHFTSLACTFNIVHDHISAETPTCMCQARRYGVFGRKPT